jgi:hypothetical protein
MFLVRLNKFNATKRVAHDYSSSAMSRARVPLVINSIDYIDGNNSLTKLKLKKSNKQEDEAVFYNASYKVEAFNLNNIKLKTYNCHIINLLNGFTTMW